METIISLLKGFVLVFLTFVILFLFSGLWGV